MLLLILLVLANELLRPESAARKPIGAFAVIVGLAEGIAGLTISFGMFTYLLMCDRSSRKAVWVIVFLLTGWLGCTVYFLKVYRSQLSQVQDTP